MTTTNPQPKLSPLRRFLSVISLLAAFCLAGFYSTFLVATHADSDNTVAIFGPWAVLFILLWWAFADLARYSLHIQPMNRPAHRWTAILSLLTVIASSLSVFDKAFEILDPQQTPPPSTEMLIIPGFLLFIAASGFISIVAVLSSVSVLLLSTFAGLSLLLSRKNTSNRAKKSPHG